MDTPGIAPIEREHDDYIMDIILQSDEFTPAQIQTLNYCRLDLGAIMLADLTNPNGIILLDNAKLPHGHISRLSNVTRWLKIRQERPSETQ